MPNPDRERALEKAKEDAKSLARSMSGWTLEVWGEDAILDFVVAWGQTERDKAELAYIKALCVYCDTEGMPTLDKSGVWGHDWEGVTKPSRSRCESHVFYELRRRRAEGGDDG